MEKFSLIVSDVDGTLVADSNKSISIDFLNLMELVKTYHIPFTIASGRSPMELREICERIPEKLPVISFNGALIMEGEKVIFSKCLELEKLREILETGDRLGLSILMGIDQEDYCFRRDEYIIHHEEDYGWKHREYNFVEHGWKDVNLYKIMFFDYSGYKKKDTGKADEIYKLLLAEADELDIIRYDEYCVEAMPKNISKASAVKYIADYLKLEIQKIISFGDSDNDLEMLEECGLGIAVHNATDKLKDVADYVCEEKDSKGVTEGIRKFYL